MVKVVLILLQIIFASSTSLARKNIDANKDFVYIGSFKSAAVQWSRIEAQNFNENNYYVSINPTVWSTADQDCKNIFGPNTGLVAIESIDEWEFLKVMLENYGFGTTFWTSGFYDSATSEWIWSLNNQTVPIPPLVPPSNPNLTLRILIYHTSRYDASWNTVVDTQLHRYICEV